uniref:Transmembrane protein 154 n=1 Tax=Pelusios castaneus TaxID=367368 RepID=A0A8C8R5K6_9SAUR
RGCSSQRGPFLWCRLATAADSAASLRGRFRCALRRAVESRGGRRRPRPGQSSREKRVGAGRGCVPPRESLSGAVVGRGPALGSEEEETSGDDTTALVVIVTPSPKTAAEFFTTASDHDLKPAITPAETEINFKTGNNASPALNDGNIPEIGNNSSPELNDLNNDNTPEAAGVQLALIFGIPVLILVLLILPIIFFVIRHKRKKSKQDELGSENVKSPIFEEDTPSVMEIEMEDLDKWMNNM